jgi:ATP-dependent DNA helicase MPH1
MLNEHPGLISATKFVGQSQGKQEIDKGFNQKEQKRVGANPSYLGFSPGEGC